MIALGGKAVNPIGRSMIFFFFLFFRCLSAILRLVSAIIPNPMSIDCLVGFVGAVRQGGREVCRSVNLFALR